MENFSYIIDTFFALFAMTLIILMVPGFAMLEAGLVRTKNVTAVLTVNTLIYAVASMGFLLLGYTLAFGSWENDSMSKCDLYDIYTPILIGLIGGALVELMVPIFDKFRLDDPVGALSVHLVNGIWGTLAVGIFASDGKDITLWGQIKGILVVAIFVFVSSYYTPLYHQQNGSPSCG